MPTYEYQCQECGQRLEVFQKFTDKPLKVHPECGGKLQKVFHASGVVFKGSGYYVTDSRPNGKDKGTSKPADSGSADSSKSESKPKKSDSSATKSETAAAAAD